MSSVDVAVKGAAAAGEARGVQARGRRGARLGRRSGEAVLRGPGLAARHRIASATATGSCSSRLRVPAARSLRRGRHLWPPGSAQGLHLAVYDIDAARADLIGRGVEVSELFHRDEMGSAPGPDPGRRSVPARSPRSATRTATAGCSRRSRPGSRAAEATRKGVAMDVETLAGALARRRSTRPYEANAPRHHWSGSYAAYIVAREEGHPGRAGRRRALHGAQHPGEELPT